MRHPRGGRCSAIILSATLLGITLPRSLPGETPAEQAEPAAKHRLVYRFRPGHVLRYESELRSSMEVRKGEAIQIIDNSTTTNKRLRVVSVGDDGAALVEPIIERVRMMVQFDDAQPARFDSASSDPPPRQFQDVQRKVGRKAARLRIAPHGELLGITRFDADGKPIVNKPNELDADGRPVEDQPDEPEFQADDNILALLPAEPVAVGDVWKERFTTRVKVDRKIERSATLQREFVLRKVEGNVATIGVRIAIITPIADPAILAQLIQRTPAGRIEFDLERGEIISRTMEQDQTIYGAIGPTSSLRAASKLVERRLESEESSTERTASTAPPRS
ncbi:MAG: hypothetical protein WD066_07270 [Planctomycetaceae bacterium]